MRLLIIPAAGRGSRLGGATPKPLVHVNGKPMLEHLADLYDPFVDGLVVVAHPSFAADIETWGRARGNVTVAMQLWPTGMLDAIMAAAPAIAHYRPDNVWITWADQVGVLPETVRRLEAAEAGDPAPALVLPTVARPDPYIHFPRDAAGRICGLRQRREGDDMPAEGESDMGLFAMPFATFEGDLGDFARDVPAGTGTGERNFLPFVPWLAQRKTVVTFPCTDPGEAVGINTPEDLQQVEAWLRTR